MTDEQGGIPSTDAAASGAPTPAPAPKRSRRRTWTAVGIVAAVIGAPYFLYLLAKS